MVVVLLTVGLPKSGELFTTADLDNYALPLAVRLCIPELVSVWGAAGDGIAELHPFPDRGLGQVEVAGDLTNRTIAALAQRRSRGRRARRCRTGGSLAMDLFGMVVAKQV